MIHPGDPLNVPLKIDRVGPSAKLIPDSELVYSPGTIDFDIAAFVDHTNGYLKNVHGKSGRRHADRRADRAARGRAVQRESALAAGAAGISQRVAEQSRRPTPISRRIRWAIATRVIRGLYLQLGRTANRLNDGYYGWKSRGARTVRFQDYSRARIASGLNAGTVGLQTMLAADRTYDQWLKEAGPDGFMQDLSEVVWRAVAVCDVTSCRMICSNRRIDFAVDDG